MDFVGQIFRQNGGMAGVVRRLLRRFSIFGPSEEDIARTAGVVSQLLVGFGFLVMIPLAFAIWNKLWVSVGALAGAEFFLLFGIGLKRHGLLKGAIVSLWLAFLTAAVVLTNNRDGAHQALRVYPCALVIAGLFLNRRTFITTAAALGGTIVLAIIANNNGWGGTPRSPYTPLPDLGNILFYLAATAVVIGLLVQHFRESLDRERARKRELLDSAERLNALNNATFEGISLTLDGKIIEANNQLAEMLGRDVSELVGCSVLDIMAPESRASAAQHMRELRTDRCECYAMRKDGSKIFVEISVRITNYRGQQVRAAAIRDITERRRTTNLLQEAALFQRAILDSLSTRIAVFDETGTIVAANQAWRDFAPENSPAPGLVNEGAHYLGVCAAAQGGDAESGRQFAGGTQKVMSGELPVYEKEYACHIAHQKRWFLGRVTPLQVSGPRRAVIAHEDITERRRMMTDLEASKLRYRTLFELHPSPLLAYDAETLGFLAVNRAAVEQYGYDKDEFLAMKITEIRPPEDIPALLEIVREQRESGRRRHGVWRHLKKDGSLIQVEVVSDRMTLGGRQAQLASAVDVTEKLRTITALQDSEIRLRMHFEQSPFGVLMFDPDTTLPVDFNDATCRQLGYSREEFARLPILDYYAGISRDEVNANVKRAAVHAPAPFETKHRTKSGEIRDVQIIAQPMRLSDRTLVHCIVVDITERKQAIKQLRLQGAALESAGNAVVITDSSGNIEWVNPAFTKLTGYSSNEAIGKNPRILNSGVHDAGLFQDMWKTITSGKIWTGELVNKRRDGSLYHQELTISPVLGEQGGVSHFVAVQQDITARKEAVDALYDSEERFHGVFEQAANGIAIGSLDGRCLFANKAACKFIGCSAEELVKLSIQDIVSEDRHMTDTLLPDLAAGIIPSYSVERRYARRDGSIVWGNATVSVVQDKAGKPKYLIGIVADITGRKVAELALRQQLEFQEILNGVLGRFAVGTDSEFDAAMVEGLKECAGIVSGECAFILQPSDDGMAWIPASSWRPPDLTSLTVEHTCIPAGGCPWLEDKVVAGSIVVVNSISELPAEAANLRAMFEAEGIKSAVYIPMRGPVSPPQSSAGVTGALGIFSMTREVRWSDETIGWLRLLSQALCNVLDRHKAGERLKHSELRYRTLFEMAQDAILITSGDKVIDFNPHALNLYGCTREQFLAQFPRHLSPAYQPDGQSSAEKGKTHQEAVLAGNPQHFEWAHQRPDGSLFDADIVMNAFPLGSSSVIMAIVRDITERKRSERALQQSRAELRDLYVKLNTLREDERKKVALEIHDHAGQMITALKFDISSAGHNAGAFPESKAKRTVLAKLESAQKFLGDVHVALVKIATSLRSAALNSGLLLALKTEAAAFAEGAGWSCRLDLPEHELALSDHAATLLFHIFQESLTNIARHAGATEVLVKLTVDAGRLVLLIEDNGRGIPPGKLGSLGLLGMQERAGSLGGRLTIADRKPGTSVTASIPYAEKKPGF